MERFILDGIDRLLVKGLGVLTVMRGRVDEKLQAIVLGPDSPLLQKFFPRELLPGKLEPGDGEAVESQGFLKRLRGAANTKVGRALQFFAGAGYAAMAGACGTPADTANDNNQPPTADSPEDSGPQFGTAKLAMEEGDLLNLGEPQKVLWDEHDQWPNISQMDGKNIITFGRWLDYSNGQSDATVWYVECDDIEKCIIEGKPQVVQGLQEAYQEFTDYQYPDVIAGYAGSIVYQDKDGQYKLYAGTGPELGGPVILDIAHTGEGEGLKVSNLSMANPPIGGVSGMTINGNPHLIGWDLNTNDTTLLNLHTNEQQSVDLSNQWSAPLVDPNGGWWVGSLWVGEGYDTGKLIAAPKLEDLGKQLGDYMMIDKINAIGGTYPYLTNPRISGKVLIFEGKSGIYYAIVQPYCGDGTPNGAETPQSCPKDFGINPGPDTVQPEPQPDTATVLPEEDIAEETGEQIDAIVTPEDTAKPKLDTVPPIDTNEDTAEPKFDTAPPVDTFPPQDTVIPPKDIPHDTAKDTNKPNPDTGSDVPPSTDTPKDTAQDATKPKPDTILPKDTNPPAEDTSQLPPDKDTTKPSKDTENPEPEPQEKSGGGGGGGCSVTW